MRHRPFLVGVALGIAALPAAYAADPTPRGERELSTTLRATTRPTGEIAIAPHVIVSREDLVPGVSATGRARVRNQTGRVLIVRVRATPADDELDRLLHVTVRVDGLPLFAGSLGALRTWSRHWFQLKRGQQRTLQVRFSLPRDADPGWRGHAGDVVLSLKSEPRYG